LKFSTWFITIRPKTLYAAISPVLLGSCLSISKGSFDIFIGMITLLATLCIQIGTNLSNDLFDFLKGTDNQNRIGPKRALQMGLLSIEQIKKAIFLIFGLSIILGGSLVVIGGFPILIIGILSIIFAIAYTGGPFPLGYNGLGDLFVFVFFGLIAVSGTFYLQTGYINLESIILGVASGSLSTTILIVNNIRDINNDRLSGKNTLAVIFGKKFAQFEYIIFMAIAYLCPLYLYFYISHSIEVFLIYLLLPFMAELIIKLFITNDENFNNLLNRTSRHMFLFSLLLSIIIIL